MKFFQTPITNPQFWNCVLPNPLLPWTTKTIIFSSSMQSIIILQLLSCVLSWMSFWKYFNVFFIFMEKLSNNLFSVRELIKYWLKSQHSFDLKNRIDEKSSKFRRKFVKKFLSKSHSLKKRRACALIDAFQPDPFFFLSLPFFLS